MLHGGGRGGGWTVRYKADDPIIITPTIKLMPRYDDPLTIRSTWPHPQEQYLPHRPARSSFQNFRAQRHMK